MDLIELESKMSHLWAKSPVSPGDSPTTLFRHSLDVTRQMAEYYRLYLPRWPLPDEPVCLERVLAYAALTHDLGKVHVAFQAMLKSQGPKFNNRHEILSLAFFGYLDVPTAELPWLEAAVALHHKNLFRLVGAGQPFFLGSTFDHEGSFSKRLIEGVKRDDAELLRELLFQADEIFRTTGWPAFPPYRVVSDDFDLLERIRQALERIAQLEKRFHSRLDEFDRVITPLPWPARRAGVIIRGLMLNADHLASFQTHRLHVGVECVEDVRRRFSSQVRELNSHQQKAANQVGSAALIAPTGSGKTEAGLLWAARQAENGGLRGRTYLLLPYQASMNTMQQRLINVFGPHLCNTPEEWSGEVALVHGRSMRAAFERLLVQDYSSAEATELARVQSDLARLNVAPIRVCSPFQILRLLFAPKGMEGLLVALSDAKLIFDEIHAYQPEVTALALTAIRLLTEQFGSRVLFMTATLPSHLRHLMEQMFAPLSVLTPDEDVLGRPPRHRLRLESQDVLDSQSVKDIVDAARTGSVLVVVNRVQRAVQLYRILKGVLCNVHLLHSRFTHSDRFQKEKQMEPVSGHVLISTQAVEVSLDLDYDQCFSELAPLESLLQRFGRCNRHGRHARPAMVTVFTKFPSGSNPWLPYNKDHLDAARRALERCVSTQRGLLEDRWGQEMLDCSYPEGLKRELAEQATKMTRELGERFVQPFAPFGMQEESALALLDRQWEQLFDGYEVLPRNLYMQAAGEKSWLARTRYLVPISGRKYAALKRQGLIQEDNRLMCDVVDAPYTEEGLNV